MYYTTMVTEKVIFFSYLLQQKNIRVLTNCDIQLSDFGCAVFKPKHSSNYHGLVGTTPYRSPEAILSK